MIRAGLTSITFRALSRLEVVRLAAEAELDGIEWGGDIHVPPGDAAAAKDAVRLCRERGLAIPSYGSYYRLGEEAPEMLSRTLDTAAALGARIVRVWAGRTGSDTADEAVRRRVAGDGRRAAEGAAERGLRIACEWHGGTLTDTAASAQALFDAVDHPAFGTYWQPRGRQSADFCLRDMDTALPRLLGLHVFHWDAATGARRPLVEGTSDWTAYLRRLPADAEIYALIEFVRDDVPGQLGPDAATLRTWLRAASRQAV